MKKILIITTFSLFAAAGLYAQSNMSVSYAIGFGTGDMGNFIGSPSFRGISLDYRHMVNENIGVGLTVGWSLFYEEKAKASYEYGNSTLTGKQFRYSNSLPILVGTTYYFKPGEKLNPFVGLGIGTSYTRRNTDMNLYTVEQDAWHFAMQPEVGVQYLLSDLTALTISGKFNQAFQSGSELTSAQSFFTLNIGFAFLSN